VNLIELVEFLIDKFSPIASDNQDIRVIKSEFVKTIRDKFKEIEDSPEFKTNYKQLEEIVSSDDKISLFKR
jgi:hypothetical protein